VGRSEAFKAFDEKVKEIRGGVTGDRIFQNYHNIPSIG